MMGLLFILAIVALACIFWKKTMFVFGFIGGFASEVYKKFSKWMGEQLTWLFFTCCLLAAMIAVGIFFQFPILTGAGFLASAVILIAIWSPVGFTLERLGINSSTFPPLIGGFIFYLCVSGCFGMLFPEMAADPMTLLYMLVFVATMITFGWAIGKKTNFPYYVILMLVIMMTLGVGTKSFVANGKGILAETIRDGTGNISAKLHTKNLKKQATRYVINGITKTDILNVYDIDAKTNSLTPIKFFIDDGTPVRVKQSKDPIVYFDGEPFVRIKLENQTNFTGGNIFFVERENIAWSDSKETEYIPGKYMLVQENEKTLYLAFLTTSPVTVGPKAFAKNKGKEMLISGYQRGELLWNDKGTGEMPIVGINSTSTVVDDVIIFQHLKRGGVIKIDFFS